MRENKINGGNCLAVSLIFDIVIALICLIIIVRNAIRGFIKSFVMLMKSVLAVFFAYLFNAPLARMLSESAFKSLSHGWVNDLLTSTSNGEGGYELYKIFDGIPDWFTKASVSAGLDEEIVEQYFVQENIASGELVDELTVIFGDALSMFISSAVAFIIIFLAIQIVLIFVGMLLNKLGKLPIWNVINFLLGAAIGVIISAVIAWLISMAIVYVFNFGSNYYPNVFRQEIIQETVIVEFFGDLDLFFIVKDFLFG